MLIKIRISFILFIILFRIKNFTSSFQNLLCSEKFCNDYKEQNKCYLGVACRVQNETFNGKILPGPVPCNCCNTCIRNLHEGDLCTMGGLGVPVPNVACGPGLICAPDENSPDDHRCKKMDHTKCLEDQSKYDKQKNSTVGVGKFVQRPLCDNDEGFYTSIKCNINQTCFCVNKEGERIFGEAPYKPLIAKTMKCECSRLNENFNKFMKFNLNRDYRFPTARCLEDGNYDPMQCVNNVCSCVRKDTGRLKYSLSWNISSKKYDLVHCYNKTIHSKYRYLHTCENTQWDLLKQLKESENDGYIVPNFEIPSCQPDGWFFPLQENETALFCVDKYGRKIDNYEVLKTSNESQNMNCKCARTRNVLIQSLGRDKVEHILPQCCANGNFKKVQCREKICYCSDENGLQIGVEQHSSNITSLECYNGGNFC